MRWKYPVITCVTCLVLLFQFTACGTKKEDLRDNNLSPEEKVEEVSESETDEISEPTSEPTLEPTSEPTALTHEDEPGSNESLAQHLWRNSQWSQIAFQALKRHGLHQESPVDIQEYCPTYEDLDQTQRVNFYVELMAAMAKKESGFNPDTYYVEAFTDRNNQRVVSRGLFQISIESANQRAYSCDFTSESEIHNPSRNIECSSNILSHWIKRDGIVGGYEKGWKGGARYWSVLRDNSKTEFIKDTTSEFCQNIIRENSFDGTEHEKILLSKGDGFSGKEAMQDDVKSLQSKLKALGYDLLVDGYYGNDTVNTLEEFQSDHGLEVNGSIVTNSTFDAIHKLYEENLR